MSKEEAEKLLESTKEQTRTNTEPKSVDRPPEVQAGIKHAFEEVLDGGASSNTTVRDVNLTALLRGLERSGALGNLTEKANDELGKEHYASSVSRSQTLALLARVGLKEVDPSLMETAAEARKEYENSKEFEF